MKDNFSIQAAQYSQFRPGYPDALISYMASLVKAKECAWDCATGNGQLAVKLAAYFIVVYATDISENQMKNAPVRKNIIYKKEPAESTSFNDKQFDLITVAQAVHWFDFDKFYKEVDRTLKDDGILAVIGYPLSKINDEVDAVVEKLYSSVLGSYWDKERRLVDEHYRTIPFPFTEVPSPGFVIEYDWTFDQLTGFLNTWSAVQHFIKKNNLNPVQGILQELQSAWGKNKQLKVQFPVLLRIGKKKS